MIGVITVVGKLLYILELEMDKLVVHMRQIFCAKSLQSRHFVEEFQKALMQPPVFAPFTFDEVDQPRKCALAVHHLKCLFILASVAQQEASDHVQRPRLIFLQQTINELRPDVVFIGAVEVTVEELVYAPSNFIVGEEVFVSVS